MADDVDFYFSFGSPPGYFASTRIDALAAAYGRGVRWRPVDLREVFAEEGLKPTIAYPRKGAYHVRDWARTARLHGIPFAGRPEVAVSPSRVVAVVFYRLADTLGAEAARNFGRDAFHAFFVDHRGVGEPSVLAELVSRVGGDREAVAGVVGAPAHTRRLEAESRAAAERGVFGSPYVIVDDEPFWGFDRFDQLERWLATGGW
ncbi:MAG: 2-hydroxychromene-2-carboxylate isomerase [Alphaproteobacteria bacterium]|jgi:2-hydroxychromene-2-carboxylate isomerase|nr:2-hydroxychromene-2-carboxylate isomerase [Alphaproteobacteria bacterium]